MDKLMTSNIFAIMSNRVKGFEFKKVYPMNQDELEQTKNIALQSGKTINLL